MLATYTLTVPHSHRILNIATLVSPSERKDGRGTIPNIVYTTTKHLPVPFFERYTHATRDDLSLASTGDRLPLARLDMPHAPNTPAPKLTPRQSVEVTTALCLDIASPALLRTYVASRQSPSLARNAAPQLILNPSFTPPHLPAIAQAHVLNQIRARAIENSAFVLLCDAGAGGSAATSTLVSPQSDTLAIVRGPGASWEYTGVEPELAGRSSPSSLKTGARWILTAGGSHAYAGDWLEWTLLAALAMLLDSVFINLSDGDDNRDVRSDVAGYATKISLATKRLQAQLARMLTTGRQQTTWHHEEQQR